MFQVRECFGRQIKSVGLEPLKPDPTTPLVPDGYRTNLPVTHLLRIAFDEQHAPDENPSCVFMLSKDPTASYRMGAAAEVSRAALSATAAAPML